MPAMDTVQLLWTVAAVLLLPSPFSSAEPSGKRWDQMGGTWGKRNNWDLTFDSNNWLNKPGLPEVYGEPVQDELREGTMYDDGTANLALQDDSSSLGSYSKRAWNNMGSTWGKRAASWNGMGNTWGKRTNWNNFNGAWGKRKGWDSFSGGWGKRSKWSNFGGSWGKRAAGRLPAAAYLAELKAARSVSR